jgi:hypothetical protein
LPCSDIASNQFRSKNVLRPDKSGWGRNMNEIKTESRESSNHVLFPMAVGVLFLVMLVAGALLG